MTTNKTVIITSGVTWTVPVDFVSLIAVHGIGGGVCGGPGFLGATDNETLHGFQFTYTDYAGTFAHGYSGDGGWYCKATTATVPLAPGQVLNLHIAAPAAPIENAGEWINKYFGGSPPDCIADDTWIKDNGGNLIVRAPGGDSSSSRVGSVRIEGGFGETVSPVNARGSSGGGGSGGPAGAPDFETQNGAQPGFVNPTQLKFFGSGGGSGNLTQSAGLPGIGNRTAAGVGGGSGASKGGDGGNITGNLSVSSSLLLPSITNPYAADAAQGNVTFDFGNRDFTIEFWYQKPLLTTAGFSGTLLSCWDTNANKGWQITAGEGSPFSTWPLLRYSTDGSDENLVPLQENPVLGANYVGNLTYYGPFQLLDWTHIAICRESGAVRVFVDGYPGLYFLSSTDYTFTPGVDFFVSTAKLTIGANLASGAVNTVIGVNGDQGPFPGWYGNMRITDGTALYTCAATSLSYLGQQFTPPTAPMTGGDFNCDWPGSKGDTISTWTDGAGNPHDVTFLGSAVIDSDQYCYPPPAPEIGGTGNAGSTGNLWTDGNLTVGPGGAGGGGGGDLARFRMRQGGDGGDGGKYGGGGGQGGGINAGVYVGLTLVPVTAFSIITAGRNIGSHHFRDPANPQFAYHLRETNNGANIEFVKIDVTTGAIAFQGPLWSYASNLGALGACFVNGGANNIDWDTNVSGGMSSGDKLYIAAQDQNFDGTFNSVIIEFDKATLVVTNHWRNGASESGYRGHGTSVMSADGTFFANGANNSDAPVTFLLTDCFIQLLKPSTGDYGYVSIKTLLGFNCSLNNIEPYNSPLCFDDTGHLWFVAQPITAIAGTDYVSGKSTLCKCSLTAGGGTISLTLVNSWMIDDNYTGYGANAFSQTFSYKRISFDPSTKKINLWSTYQAAVSSAEYEQGWYLEWSTLSETFTRGPSSWTAGSSTTQRSPLDLIGWTGGVDSLIVLKQALTTPAVSIFNIASGRERAYPIISTWSFSDAHQQSMRGWTFVYSSSSFEIYAFDEGGFNPYTDALFTLTEPDIQPGLGGLGEQGLIVIEYVSSESPALTGNVTETLSPIDTQSSQLIGGAQTTEALNPVDAVDATLIPVTRPKWLTIGGDSSDSIFPN